jgi:hypothetical protein
MNECITNYEEDKKLSNLSKQQTDELITILTEQADN